MKKKKLHYFKGCRHHITVNFRLKVLCVLIKKFIDFYHVRSKKLSSYIYVSAIALRY